MSFTVHCFLLASVARWPSGRLPSSPPSPGSSHRAVQVYGFCWELLSKVQTGTVPGLSHTWAHVFCPIRLWQWLSKCGPSISISILRELVRNANSRASPNTYWIRSSRAQQLAFYKDAKWFQCNLKLASHCPVKKLFCHSGNLGPERGSDSPKITQGGNDQGRISPLLPYSSAIVYVLVLPTRWWVLPGRDQKWCVSIFHPLHASKPDIQVLCDWILWWLDRSHIYPLKISPGECSYEVQMGITTSGWKRRYIWAWKGPTSWSAKLPRVPDASCSLELSHAELWLHSWKGVNSKWVCCVCGGS